MNTKSQSLSTAELITRSTVKIIFTDPNTETPELISELTEILHRHNLILSVKGKTKIGAPKINPTADTTLIFTDINKQITLPNPKTARKFLRKHSHTVTTCRKEKDQWIFHQSSQSIKLYFKTHTDTK